MLKHISSLTEDVYRSKVDSGIPSCEMLLISAKNAHSGKAHIPIKKIRRTKELRLLLISDVSISAGIASVDIVIGMDEMALNPVILRKY